MTCGKCPLAPFNNFEIVKSRGNINGKIFIIGESPGYKDKKLGYAFVGKTGNFVQSFVNDYGLNGLVYFSNAVKCRAPNNRTPYNIELKTCRPRLLDEIGTGKPNIIILLGNTAINQFFGKAINAVSKLNNKVVKYGNTFIIFGFHPAYVMNDNRDHHYHKLFMITRAIYKLKVSKYI